MDNDVFDAVVIGGGIMGSWTTAELLKAGTEKVLMLEKFPLPHTRGSSHGATRISRYAYPELHQTILAKDALEGWTWLQNQSQDTLIVKVPLLWTTDEEYSWEVTDALKSIKTYCPETSYKEFKEQKEIADALPNLDFSDVLHSGLLVPDSYVLMADKCLAALRAWIVANNGVIRDGTEVEDIVPGERILLKVAGGQQIVTRSLVICAGTWSKPLLQKIGVPADRLPLKVKKIPVMYFPEKPGKRHPNVSMIHTSLKHPCLWSIPSLEYPGLVKFGPHYGPETDPDRRDEVSVEESVKAVSSFVEETCEALLSTPAIVETCMYTVTPDEVCILDRHPEHENIAYGCGFSGAGFKLGPSIGAILSCWALGKECGYDLSAMRSRRFAELS